LEVYSFFRYQHIEDLLLTKHTAQGFSIYRALAEISLKPFITKFLLELQQKVYILGIDESIKNGYSHVALLTHKMKTPLSQVLHAKLIANNPITYAGKTLQYRLAHPRNFYYSGRSNIEVILVDDIVTTGTTLQEASSVLAHNGVKVLFALTLADAKS
jgi:competence protein ComFC